MTQQEALSALFNNAARRPVDVNLGQVPLTPTIGRMGNYNVVVRDTPRDNSALELSRALSQLPQLLGQARNISAASGARQAEEITLEELETKVKNGDADAKGTMTWLGADKAYQELAYKRLADANITPTLTNISSEIDRMSHAELLKFNSPDDIKDHVQGRLVGSLDPGIMETIKGKPWMEIRHNRYMEAIVPEYVEKVNASIEGRKHEFKIKEAIAALETNFLAQAGINLEDIPTEQIDSVLAVSQEAKFDPSQMWLDNFQYALDFARSQGEASGLDRFQIEDTLIPALTAKYNMLVEDEHHSEADLLLEAMESGSLKINGRPINKSSAGMRLIQNAEARLERSLEADEAGIDIEKINGIKSDTLRFLSGEKVKPGYDPDSMIPLLQQQENDLYNDPANPMSNKEIIELSGFFARTRDGVRGRGEIHSETSDAKREELGEDFRKTYKSVNPEEISVSVERDALEKAFLDAGGDPEFWDNQLTTTILDPEGQKPPKVVFQNPASRELADAASQASRSTVATFIDRPIEELFLGDVASEDIEKQSQLRTQITDKADEFFIKEVAARLLGLQESFKAQNPPLTPEEAQKRQEIKVDVKQARRRGMEELRKGETILNAEGEITPVYRSTRIVDGKSVDEFVYPLSSVNKALNNEFMRGKFKDNTVDSKLKAFRGMYIEATDSKFLQSKAEDIESVYGQPEEESLVKSEIDRVKYTGLPLTTLYNGAAYETTTSTGGSWFFDIGAKVTDSAINYDKYENFSKPSETKKRIFNLPAVIDYIQNGDQRALRSIHKNLLKDKMPLKDFINNQVTFFESFAGDITNAQNPQQNNK